MLEKPLDFDQNHEENPQECRYRSVAPWLHDTSLAIFSSVLIAVVALTITGLVDHRIQNGFNSTFAVWISYYPDFIIEKIDNFDESMLYRGLPALLMSYFSILWIRADIFYRTIQPFAGMQNASPPTFNILLDYPSCPPVLITLKAIKNKHWRVAFFSVLSLLSPIPPIVATGLFISTPTPIGFTISIEPINFWACFVILIVYLFCLVIVRPTSGYRLPRYAQNLGDVLCYCYASGILDDTGRDGNPVFSVQAKDDCRIHLESRIHLAKREYEFGLYLGKDGKRHVGFDIASRQEFGREILVTKIEPGRYFWRRPQVKQTHRQLA